ncbi:XylB Sugar (pentulose and hexulose) kinases [Candidatus Nanopelagicaceae bacterium]
MARVAGVDSSTQSVKIVVRDSESGALLAEASRPHPDGTEVDPQHWLDALYAVIAEIGGLESLDAISIGGQQHGMVLLDSEGEVIRPALLWNDTRSAAQAAAINAAFPDIVQRTGSQLVASFTASKVRWVLENEPENAARIAAIALPHDWLSWKLSGSTDIRDIFTDRSDASGTGYFDPINNIYIPEILEWVAGKKNMVLPRIVAPGEVGARVGKTVIACGAGDNAGAALGIGAVVGDLIISLGTSGTAFAVSSSPSHDQSGEVAGFADATGHFLPLACTLNAAKIFDATAKLLGVGFEEYSQLALQASPGADGLMMAPHFDGERTPNRPDALGAISGITHTNFTPANVARASIEGVIAGLAYAAEALRKEGVEISRLLLVGGAARNKAVQQITSEIFGLPVHIPTPGEYVSEGAAIQAAWALHQRRPQWSHNEMTLSHAEPEPTVLARYLAALGTL